MHSVSQLVPLTWGELVEEEERAEAQEGGYVVTRPATVSVAKAIVRPRPQSTHPASMRNDGRPPPTAVWGPPKAPRAEALTRLKGSRRQRQRDGLAAREFAAELNDYSDESSSLDEVWGWE